LEGPLGTAHGDNIKKEAVTAATDGESMREWVGGRAQTGTVRMQVRPREGLLLWGLESAPTCRLDLRFTLTGRTGINLSVPVTHFPKMADFVEELVKGLFTEELVWPQCACVNILPPPFTPVEFRCVNCELPPVLFFRATNPGVHSLASPGVPSAAAV
jgi:hypothetical protein